MAWLNTLGLFLAFFGMLSIPFLNNNVDLYTTHDYNDSLAPILDKEDLSTSDANHYPGSAQKTFGPAQFLHKAETAFGTFSVETRNFGAIVQIKQALVNSDVRIEHILLNNQSFNDTWILYTTEYSLSSTRGNNKVTEVFSTAAGSCTKEMQDGTVSEACTGQISNLDNKWDDAKDKLEEWAEKLNKAAKEVELPNIQSSQWEY